MEDKKTRNCNKGVKYALTHGEEGGIKSDRRNKPHQGTLLMRGISDSVPACLVKTSDWGYRDSSPG